MANFISMFRIMLAFVVVTMLFYWTAPIYWTAFFLTIIVIWMDGLDGFVARKFNEVSKFGAVLDILGDRIVENIFWITFLALGWLPVWVPIVVVTRGIITDGLRSVALEQGYTAFGSATMMTSKIGKFIVTSNFCRFSYAVLKAIAFCFLILAHHPSNLPNKEIINVIAYFSAYGAVIFCVLRGIPVIIESKRFFPKKA
ncbi:MAG: CDP-alcohol phosphatidyltransferase family protein [Candidatus Gastranaerophilales bacterium]|nr:CDP-alcohol phosphatidyltransferase family protein [Candidatus Gastranaerophilales bacterium]